MKSNLSKLKIICVFAFLCLSKFSSKAQSQTPAEKKDEFTYTLIPEVNNTWGYDIFVNKQLKIHQPNIPGSQGSEGFKTKEAAESIAKLVIGKMKKGEMPPSVTIKEMKKLKAI